MDGGGEHEANPVTIICPCCKRAVSEQMPVRAVRAVTRLDGVAMAFGFGKDEDIGNYRTFWCDSCGIVFAPLTEDQKREWDRRFEIQSAKAVPKK